MVIQLEHNDPVIITLCREVRHLGSSLIKQLLENRSTLVFACKAADQDSGLSASTRVKVMPQSTRSLAKNISVPPYNDC